MSTAQNVLIAVAVFCSPAAAGQPSIADDTAVGGGVWQGVPVRWTAHPANPVLSPGPPGAWDEQIRERMWVIYDAGRFHGWYGGWKGKYDKRTPNLVHLGYATSADGVRWTKHANNPVFAQRWVEDVCVVKLGDTYYLYGEDETENRTVIHLLTSTDGVQWTARGSVLEKTAGSDWEGGWVGTPLVWKELNQWCMLYEGGPPGDVGLATSADGVHWHKSPDNPVLRRAAQGAWDGSVVGPSSILQRNGRYYLFYIGGGGSQFRDGLATSTDLVHWSRYPRNPLIGDMSAVFVDTPGKSLLYCRQNPAGLATTLYFSSAQGGAHVPQNPPPFYQDKMNLLVWLDPAGRPHEVKSPEDWRQRREHILANMQLVMGPLPASDQKVPLDVHVLGTETLSKVTRKKITYAAGKGDRVPAYLLIPRGLQGRAPAVLCLHGTSGGRGRTAGLGEDYPRYTLELAERGYVTVAPDYPLLAENQTDPYLLGYVSGTMKGIWDHIRAVDLLESLPEVDNQRIGCIGLSLGGHNALFVGAFDPRIKVIVSSSGFDSLADYMGGDLSGWCQPRYMPRLASLYGKDLKRVPFDFPEVLAALAPRHVYVHAPLGDTNFRVQSARRCVEAAGGVYGLLGVGDRLVAVYPPGGHGFPEEARQEAYGFIDKVLARGVDSHK